VKIAKTVLDLDALRRALDLPDSFEIVNVYTTPDPVRVWIVLRSEEFPEIPDDSEAPIIRRVETRSVEWR